MTQIRPGKGKRGFASMDPEQVREIASAGGRAAHRKGAAHQWTPDEAAVAGKKGAIERARRRKKEP